MEITINVDATDIDLKTEVGERRRWDSDAEEYETVPQTLGDAVAARIAKALQQDDGYKTLRTRVMEARDAEIRDQVKPIVAEAIASSVQPTNSYGQPVGQPVSLTELIVKEAREVLNRRDGYGDKQRSYIQQIVAEAVDKAIRTELGAAIADEKAKVVAAIRARAADLIAQAVKEGIGR